MRVYALEPVTPPSDDPILFDDAKSHLKIDDDDDDLLVATYLAAARAWAENYTNRALALQTWKLSLDCFPYEDTGGNYRLGIKLPKPPLQSVSSIYYYNTSGVLTLLAASEYEVDSASQPGWIYPAVGKSWPSTYSTKPNAVEVIFKCGYAAAADAPNGVRKIDMPPDLRLAVLMHLGHFYENRQSVTLGVQANETPQSAKALAFPHQVRNV